MKKYLLTIIFSLIIGFFLGNFLLKQYDDYKGVKVSNIGNEVYFLEYGVYPNLKEMEENTMNLENYIYNIESDKYYVYVGITLDTNNAEKIKNHFKNLGYETTVKTYYISNKDFIEQLKNYDSILSKTDDSMAISSIISETLQKYEEVVNNGNKD